MIADSKRRYGKVSMALHWTMAALIGWQLLKFGDYIAKGEHWVSRTFVPWHISIGMLLLGLVVLRSLWAASQRKHRPRQNPATALLVKTGHALLYAGMVLLPVTGALTMVGGGYGLTVFGLELVGTGDRIGWAAALGSLHAPVSWGFTLLVAGHIIIALAHHFIRRDDTLRRML
ncbi:MAG: cytochrome b [Sphingobium sp.]